MSNLKSVLSKELAQRQQQQLYRQRQIRQSPPEPLVKINGKNYLGFCSNDYLGLAHHPEVIQAAQTAAKTYGVGASASHLILGHHQVHHELEQKLAAFTGFPRALLFCSGYMANMGVINALIGTGDRVFHDALNHASLLDGAWLSQGSSTRYPHNDLPALNTMLTTEQNYSRRLIITESVFSMDGDMADIPAIIDIATQHKAWTMIDDAHGLGVLGSHGGGIRQHLGLQPEQLDIYVGTLGKALGTQGAFVAGSDELIEWLIQRARSYIYTTALSPILAAATLTSLKIVQQDNDRRQHLQSLIAYFRQLAEAAGLPLENSLTAIQPIIFGAVETTLAAADYLASKGILVSAIRPPTVPKNTSRLRITLSAAHTKSQVEQLVEALSEIHIKSP
ncbi:MAG: 8-amino-7-oxononanoate synthase [Pseudomonadales bacterium]|nr:8-amino-7-oxononanoate synthase [Pseudomonadales bacterium]